MPNIGEWLNNTFEPWSRLTAVEKRAIRDFPILWAHFELYATRRNANPESIIDAVVRLNIRSEHEAVRDSLTYFSARFFPNAQEDPRYQAVRIRAVDDTRVRQVLIGGNRHISERLTVALLIVNRLRNNFLHGEKAANGFEDQLDNFKNCNAILIASIPYWYAP